MTREYKLSIFTAEKIKPKCENVPLVRQFSGLNVKMTLSIGNPDICLSFVSLYLTRTFSLRVNLELIHYQNSRLSVP